MSADEVKTTIERGTRLLEEWGAVEPLKRSRYWVRLGVKNQDGEFTLPFDGEAIPSPDSVIARFGNGNGNGNEPRDRLVWFLRNADELCLEGQTARSIIGSADVAHLVDVVRAAVEDGLVERWSDQGGTPAQLDPLIHQYRVVGVRLTPSGKVLASKLEETHDPHRPWSTST